MKALRNSKEISKNILATVAYYDVFSYPLTSFEIWKRAVTGKPVSIRFSMNSNRIPLSGS